MVYCTGILPVNPEENEVNFLPVMQHYAGGRRIAQLKFHVLVDLSDDENIRSDFCKRL